ncbi:MAG: HAD hydrolase family protein [Desulfobacteraceae bacterium]|nr:HAD hydrolase family protein [Desulfobacteraceae bacterium]
MTATGAPTAAAGSRFPAESLARARRIKLLLLDVDGVLTDGAIVYTGEGTEIKAFHIQDGLGLKLLQKAGIEAGVITARESAMVRRRVEELGLAHLFQGFADKLAAYEKVLAGGGLQPEEIAYMGDDWLDLPLLTRVGLAATVADAVPEVKEAAHFVATRGGGRGAVREVCDLLLEARGLRLELLRNFLK